MRSEEGFSVVEGLVASALTLTLLAALGVALVSSLRTSTFGTNQSETLDKARLVLNQVQRDLQGSKQFENCTQTGQPAGSCVLVVTQPPAGADAVVRYRLVGSTLYREIDNGTGTFPTSLVTMDKLANLTTTPLFTCTNVGSLLHVTVNMLVQPKPTRPSFQLQTLVRPRNTYQPPSC